MNNLQQLKYEMEKKTRRGFRGYPIATIAFYGPDNLRASKVVVGILAEDEEIIEMKKWFSEECDLRRDLKTLQQILSFIEQHQASTVVMLDHIIGCPHEEGIDYPNGEKCPQCPFWANRDRWTGEYIQ